MDEQVQKVIDMIDASEFKVALPLLVADCERRIAEFDAALGECKVLLIATEEADFHPQGWELPVAATAAQVIEQRGRVQMYLSELQRRAESEGVDLSAADGDAQRETAL